MGELFNCWRRRIGLALLVMAMPLAMCWVRSFVVSDTAALALGIRHDQINSNSGRITWKRTNRSYGGIHSYITSRKGVSFDPLDDCLGFDIQWRWTWMGFDLGATTQYESWSPNYLELWVIPYWSLVLPPTLLAAYLLLTKPQSLKPPVSIPDASRAGG